MSGLTEPLIRQTIRQICGSTQPLFLKHDACRGEVTLSIAEGSAEIYVSLDPALDFTSIPLKVSTVEDLKALLRMLGLNQGESE